MPALSEIWTADGNLGETFVLLTEHVAGMDDAALLGFLTKEVGFELCRVTISRRDTHTYVNLGYQA